MFCKTIERDKGRKLYLYSSQKREYNEIEGLPSIDQNNQHLRWNSLRNEWVFYSPARQKRTFLPNVSNCPLCPSQKDGMKTDIPLVRPSRSSRTKEESSQYSNAFTGYGPNCLTTF